MKFRFTDEQRMLQEGAERFLSEHSPIEVARQAAMLPGAVDLALWARITEELGWQAIPVAESHGGLGLGLVELVVLLEATGACLSPTPFYATALSALALGTVSESDGQQHLLKSIAEGTIVAFAHTAAQPEWGPSGVAVSAMPSGDRWCLNGSARFVMCGAVAEYLLVAALFEDKKIMLFSVPSTHDGLSVSHRIALDQTRSMADLYLQDVVVDGAALLAVDWAEALANVLDIARIMVAAEQVGCAQRALDMTVDYVAERVQFGRTIASFQAVKHKAADMMLKVESARSLLYYAACTADSWIRGTERRGVLREAAAMVASSAGDTAFFVAGTGIQLHGGVGITEEYDIQLYFKRARALEAYLGRPDESREVIAAALLDTSEAGIHAA
jgi:alkylation response protein AidB-like acyl-CoA dehydrogenase